MVLPNNVVAVTGVSGQLGTVLASTLADDPRVERIVGIDCRAPDVTLPKVEFHQHDMTVPGLDDLFHGHQVSHVAHLAFRLAPDHDRAGTRRVNFEGSRNVLQAAAAVGAKHIAFASSSVVYGPQPHAPGPIDEQHARHPTRQVQYTMDKIDIEDLCGDFRRSHPETNVSVLRLVTAVGPQVDNFIFRSLQQPLVVTPWHYDPPWQFVHQLDAARAFQSALFCGRSGTYNVGADGTVRLSEILRALDKPTVALPRGVMKLVTNLCWYLRLRQVTEIPGALIDFMCDPPVVSNAKLKDALDFEFRYSSSEAIATYIAARRGTDVRVPARIAVRKELSGARSGS